MSELKKRYCSQCGSEVDETCKFCPNCGAKIVKAEKNEKDEISAVMEELFETEEVKHRKEDTVVIPKFSEPVRQAEPVQEEIYERPRATAPKSAQRPQTRRPVEKESKLPVILTVAAVALVVVLIAGGGFMIYRAMQSPAEPNPPVVDNNNNQDNNNQDNNQNNNQQNNSDGNKPTDKPIATNDDKIESNDKNLKEGVAADFTSDMGQLEGLAAITEIMVQDMDNGNLRFTISYESATDLTMIFANAPDGQIFRIEVDVTSGGQAAYFEVSKSILSKDMALMVTLFEQIQEGSASDGTPIGSGSATISAETMAELLELAGE